jgi:hypothetical protein
MFPFLAGRRQSVGLGEVFDALCWIVRTAPVALAVDQLPWAGGLPGSPVLVAAACFEALVHDLRAILRLVGRRAPQSTTIVLDGCT